MSTVGRRADRQKAEQGPISSVLKPVSATVAYMRPAAIDLKCMGARVSTLLLYQQRLNLVAVSTICSGLPQGKGRTTLTFTFALGKMSPRFTSVSS